jgi:hypothetical protein
MRILVSECGSRPTGRANVARDSQRQAYLRRLEKRPKWAEQFMDRLIARGEIPARCLDGRFWMCLKAGFRPMRDIHWDWWCSLNWIDQNWFYEQGEAWIKMGRQLKRKRNPESALNRVFE